MTELPSTERFLFGPGPSLVTPRVMRALGAPVLGHLDPQFVGIMDDLRSRLARTMRAPEAALALAVSGTGTAAMEAAVANLVEPGTQVLVVVTGYFGARLVEMCTRYGGSVVRVDGEWGRAIDPAAVEAALSGGRFDLVAIVHAETSTGVRNPVREVASLAHAHGALVLVDAVTSLGGQELDMAGWRLDACYSGTQKCIGAPSGLAPLAFAPSALARRVKCRSFYLDLSLLEDYWVHRKYHHTMSASLVYALNEALAAIDEEGLDARWARHAQAHRLFASAVYAMGLELLPPSGERLMTLNTVRIPASVDDASVRTGLRDAFNIEIGSGIGPLAGKIWRIGLMGAGATPAHVQLLVAALESVLARSGHRAPPGAGVAAIIAASEAAAVQR
jgi:alanine-glyoxylate transaminase / serine-glyoxylate transaminase / serine-pyruvate transaminase